ncbi:MAG: ABC transporter ATP-binding protein, partial [Actinomadura sp.]
RAELQAELLRLQAELHKTIVFVTHDIDEAIKLGDQIAVFRTGGRLVQFDTPEDLLAHPADEFVAGFIGQNRGIRSLSFAKAARLRLRDDLVRTVTSDGADTAGLDWVLVVDEGRRPLGWARGAEVTGPLAEARLAPVGTTFCVETDSVRGALDAAVLSPAGLAVGLDGDGSVVGVVGGEDLLAVPTHGGSA